MAPIVRTPVEGFTGTVAGVNFADGAGATDDPAALLYFGRAGYAIETGEKPDEGTLPVGTSQADEEQTEVDPPAVEDDDEADETSTEEQAERPHPVQGSKAVWYEHLTKLNPAHGFDLATVSRKELIAAVEAIEQG